MIRLLSLLIVAALAVGAYFFPLHLALGFADFDRFHIETHDVSGSVWEGRVGDVLLRDQSLGAFTARLDPAGLTAGSADMAFARVDHPDGPLTGILRSDGARRGIVGADGRIAVKSLFAPVPVETIGLTDASVVFDGDRCAEASGIVTADVGITLLGYRIGRSLTGDLSCAGDEVRIAMRSQTGLEEIDLTFGGDGRYRADMRVDARRPEISTGLALLGFRRDGYTLTRSMTGAF